MEPFDRYFKKKMTDPGFSAFYAAECHVCERTVKIFEKVETEAISLKRLAAAVDTDPAALEALRDADCCDPQLVVRLCRHLGLEPPSACPRLKTD